MHLILHDNAFDITR